MLVRDGKQKNQSYLKSNTYSTDEPNQLKLNIELTLWPISINTFSELKAV
jgi:hypothetical protein